MKDFDPDDKIVNRFEEILRHNNVSDKENAFNRLVALFICKLVDEIKKQDNDVVEFQYQQGTDTYETLQDRLQRLHTEGMQEFMGEKIFYVSNDYAENLFKNYTNHKRERAIEDLKNTIRILKFYSNNDFSFKDVHNEELFFQNGKILVEVVQLFENHRIVYPSKHQFLGDLFEQLLNKGFKQSEGQFFTPTPITRFIWDSLPLAEIPKVIDYACGSGHFLTEAVESINNRLTTDENNSWVEKHIFGIEKDYRLARVSKISLFMNGAGGGNIIFGDWLENQPEKHIENNAFDILVANPPYSVSAFKSHLKLKNNSFHLLNRISNDGSEIETLFVERIAQLLKPQGIAAVVLPSSILSNNSGSYTGAREILLKNFLIRSIVQFGSKTFGATGTNTVVLFLEKYNEPPKQSSLKYDSANAIIHSAETDDWEDGEILSSYLQKIQVTNEDYRKFTEESVSFDGFSHCEYLNMYADAFLKLPQTVKSRNSNAFKKLTVSEQSEKLKQEFYSYAKPIEFEKLFYFALTYKQTVFIVTAPNDNDGQKRFLGYYWSDSKGYEGIHITQAGGMLYNETDRNATSTIASSIRSQFTESLLPNLGDKQQYCALANLGDMIDFSRITFNKAIKLTPDKKIEIRSKYPLVKLGEIAEVLKGKSITSAQTKEGNIKVVAGGIDYAYFHNEANREPNTITISASGANAGFVNLWKEPIFASDCTTVRGKNVLHTFFLYNFLLSIQDKIFTLQKGAGQPHVYPDDIKLLQIPDIDENLQHQIVSECEKIDEEYNTSRMSIEEYKKKIVQEYEQLEVLVNKNSGGYNRRKISELCKELFAGGDVPKDNWSSEATDKYKIPIYSNGTEDKSLYGYTNISRVNEDAITISARGTIGYTAIRKAPFFPIVRLIVAIPNEKILLHFFKFVLSFTNISDLGKTGGTIPQLTVPMLKDLSIPVPPLTEQEKIVAEVSGYEAEIAKAQAVMAGCADRKKAMLERWLG